MYLLPNTHAVGALVPPPYTHPAPATGGSLAIITLHMHCYSSLQMVFQAVNGWCPLGRLKTGPTYPYNLQE